ncbi:hypothetical protein BJ166DRAFT_64978 [Pestalotiopsis sp. NC0098]|nr:hypothetical protein BJ166DRAFT_64978 [Pestalotiopsis sp. NC0098]
MPRAVHSGPRSPPRWQGIKRQHLAGYIGWLPPMSTEGVDRSLSDGCYNHPIVILSPLARDGKVVILILTSFDGVDLATKHRSAQIRQRYLPISPSPAHPDNKMLLHLDHSSLPLRKASNAPLVDVYNAAMLSSRAERAASRHSARSTRVASTRYRPRLEPAGHHDTMPHVAVPIPSQAPEIRQTAGSSSRADGRSLVSGYVEPRPAGRIDRPTRSVYMPTYNYGSYGTINSSRTSRQSGSVAISRSGAVQWGRPSGPRPWTVLEILFWCTVTILGGYGAYRAGCWTVWAVGAAIDGIKHAIGTATDATRHAVHVAIEAIKSAPVAVKDWIAGLL